MFEFMGLTVTKGQLVPMDEVMRVMQEEDIEQAPIFLLRFRDKLQTALRAAGYKANVTARTHIRNTARGVKWLTDAEALAFNNQRRSMGKRKIYRAKAGYDNIVVVNLTEHEQRDLDLKQRLAAQELSAMRRENSKVYYRPFQPAH